MAADTYGALAMAYQSLAATRLLPTALCRLAYVSCERSTYGVV